MSKYSDNAFFVKKSIVTGPDNGSLLMNLSL